jgi:hypothetical protein
MGICIKAKKGKEILFSCGDCGITVMQVLFRNPFLNFLTHGDYSDTNEFIKKFFDGNLIICSKTEEIPMHISDKQKEYVTNANVFIDRMEIMKGLYPDVHDCFNILFHYIDPGTSISWVYIKDSISHLRDFAEKNGPIPNYYPTSPTSTAYPKWDDWLANFIICCETAVNNKGRLCF